MKNSGNHVVMKKIKQVLSLLLVVSMLIGYAPAQSNVYAESTPDRYTVLILDTSGSMAGIPLEAMKEAAKKFCSSLFQTTGNNYVAIVSLNAPSVVKQEFTSDLPTLEAAIDGLRSSGGTNMTASLEAARNLLLSIPDNDPNIKKNVVLCSDGLPQDGATTSYGPYNSKDYSGYRYANATYEKAMELHDICSLYTLGFFHSLSSSSMSFASRFMSDIQNAGYTEVIDPDDLIFEFGNIAETISGAFDFYYASGEEEDFASVCYYNDRYFDLDPTQYNAQLATMSLCLALSGFGSNDARKQNEAENKSNLYENRDANVRDLLTKIGFGGEKTAANVSERINGKAISSNEWFNVKPQSDSIGVAFGHKKIQDKEVIAVVLRGAGYESEWAGNFTLGKTGQHYGFNKAKEQVLDALDEYLIEQNITGDVKLWIVGYSRGAATANLVAADLTGGEHNLKNVSFSKKDLFAYCFETPQGTITSRSPNSAKYNNIWNVINKNDPVPKVAMSDLDFRRYGQDYILPNRLTDADKYDAKKSNMLAEYYQLPSVTKNYIVDDFEKKVIELRYAFPGGESIIQTDTKNSNQSVFLDELINKLTVERIKTRTNYVNEFQNGVRVIFTFMYGTLFPDEPVARVKDAMNIFINKFTELDVLGEIALSALGIGNRNLEQVINDILTESLNEAGINNVSPKELTMFVEALVELILKFAVSHPNLTITAAANLESLGAAHYPELCFAWLRSQDRYYTNHVLNGSGDGGYRIVRINCPVDVEVVRADGTIVGAIYDNIPQELGEDSIITMFNENQEKLVYLPNTQAYRILLTATDNGTMSYGLSEYSTSAGTFTKNINYINIKIQKDEVYLANVPAADDINPVKATDLDYTLIGPNSEYLEPTSVLNDEEVASAYYKVTVVSENTTKGLAIGSEIYQYGSYALADAVPLDGYYFAGWYEGNQLVSQDSSYRFMVDKDVVLTARFDGSGGSGSNRSSDDDDHNTGTWILDATGWWYRYSNGTWPTNQWMQLSYNGKYDWYYFKPDGYMATGWLYDNGHKYYMNPVSDGTQGRMMTGWAEIEGKWYYFNEVSDGTKGALIVNSWIDGYWVDENGVWDGLPKQ